MIARILLVAVLAAPLAAPAASLAADREMAGAKPKKSATAKTLPGFNRLDKNKDGMLSRDEIGSRSPLAKRFDALDKNADGMLSRSEYATARTEAARKPREGRKPQGAGSPSQLG